MADNACIVTVGGTMLRTAWDEGRTSAWRYAYTTPNAIYSEPNFFALYPFMSGLLLIPTYIAFVIYTFLA